VLVLGAFGQVLDRLVQDRGAVAVGEGGRQGLDLGIRGLALDDPATGR